MKWKISFDSSSAFWKQIAVALVGLLFCLWVYLSGGKSLCLTNGCSVFQDFKIAGFSLWQGGIFFFSLCLLFSLFRLRKIALILTASALCAEIILLVLMLLTAPCVNCLIVGSLIALNYFLHWREQKNSSTAKRICVPLIPWLLLLCFNTGIAFQDAYSPWSVIKNENTSVNIFFSPSCSACRELVHNYKDVNSASWFPVSENFRDNFVIRSMTNKIIAGMPLAQAMEEARKELPPEEKFNSLAKYKLQALSPEMLLLQLRLWRNYAAVLSAGSNQFPLVIIKGLPDFLTNKKKNTQRDESFPINLNASKFCGGDKKEENCGENSQMEQRKENLEELFKDSGLY